MMKFKYYFLILFIVASFSCSKSPTTLPIQSGTIFEKSITIDIGKTFQTMDGFGASDCWTANYVGRDWSFDQREAIARLLFSKEIKEGDPEGISLSMWRFNLGAGTSEQGNASGIEDQSRRAECFLNEDGTFNWQKQQGQQFFLEKAHEYGCNSFVMFSNSPPVYYTFNGKGYSDRGAYSNLKPEHYTDFALYMANVASYFKNNKNIPFSYISPVNEPQYNWDAPSQEGTGWQNKEIKHLAVELDKALTQQNLESKILITESGDWEYLYKSKGNAGRSNQIKEFFSPQSENYIGDLSHVPPLIGGHSYWTDGNWNTLSQVRQELASAAASHGLKIYQTEWSMLGDHYNDKDYPGNETSTYLDIALHMAKVMHHDLTTANVSSWSYWTALDMDRWNHKNRFLLIKLTPAGGAYGDISQSGSHEAMKNLWVLGNYSLFIRPGYQRIDLNIKNPSDSFFGSAWLSPSKDKVVIVFTNMTANSLEVALDLKGMSKKHLSIKRYVTSSRKNLQEDIPKDDICMVDPQSVTTFVLQY